jgi:hypothetical protein
MFEDLYREFTKSELELLARASADDVMAPPDSLQAFLPTPLRARFMALVVARIGPLPMDDANIHTDPQ